MSHYIYSHGAPHFPCYITTLLKFAHTLHTWYTHSSTQTHPYPMLCFPSVLTTIYMYMYPMHTCHITYIWSCYIHLSTCSQQALHYIMMTILTGHIQWSCIDLVKKWRNKTNQTYKFMSSPPCTCMAICNGEQGEWKKGRDMGIYWLIACQVP